MPAEKPVVCIVDDDQSVRDSLVFLVQCSGYSAVPFASAEQFLEADEISQAEFLIVDVRLPGMTGIELLDRLAVAGRKIPAIVITGHADSEDLRQSPNLCGVRFLSKPSDPEELLAAISAAVDRNN